MNENEWWYEHIKNLAVAALKSLSNIYPGCPVYIDRTFSFFFNYLQTHEKIPIRLINAFDKSMEHKSPDDTVVVVGVPEELAECIKFMNRDVQIVFQ